MNAKNAKTTFTFNVFLTSIVGLPLLLDYRKVAQILNISQPTLSKLRHGKQKQLPLALAPNQVAARFGADVAKSFPGTIATVQRFAEYAQLLNDRYIFSESMARFVSMFLSGSLIVDGERVKKFCSGMIPELLEHCYLEAYTNTEQESRKWMQLHAAEKTELIFQKMYDTFDEQTIDSIKMKKMLDAVFAANLRNPLPGYCNDLEFIENLGSFIHSQLKSPFYQSITRNETISISMDSKMIFRTVRAQEKIVVQSMQPFEFVLTQQLYHDIDMRPEEIIQHAFSGLACTVNHKPLIYYVNTNEHTNYTSPLQLVGVNKTADRRNGRFFTELKLRFMLYPVEAGIPISVSYEYSSASVFIPNVSCIYSYSLRYPCKTLVHDFVLDQQTRRRWGVWVKIFTPVTNSEMQDIHEEDTQNTCRVAFNDWAMPGAGYYRNLYELDAVRAGSTEDAE